ncbi:MAG: hypothetical protein H6728_06630 [Myxococcales bacterium]|nr:hypothetical protein [Myxococcales bacterium]MCB9642736.1 hypothetical protein [Myxococcales bacterium]
MWFPEFIEGGLSEKLVMDLSSQWSKGRHRWYVQQREVCEEGVAMGEKEIAACLSRWRGLSWVFGGMRHGQWIGPYAGFSFAPTLGGAYLEGFVDAETLSLEKELFPTSWHTNALCGFLWLLFRKHKDIETLVLPTILSGFFVEGWRQQEKEGRAWIVREDGRL